MSEQKRCQERVSLKGIESNNISVYCLYSNFLPITHVYIYWAPLPVKFLLGIVMLFFFLFEKNQLLIFIHHHPPPHYTVSSFSFLFLPGVSYVAKDELELFSLLSLPPKCWEYHHALWTPLCCVPTPSAPCMKCKHCTTKLDSHSLGLNRLLT